MYIPHVNAVEPAAVGPFVRSVGAADLVTVAADGTPVSTLMPVVWLEEESRVVMHMARANPHWSRIEPGARALAIVSGPQAYVSPSWYASKAEHGKVVPTWNYSAVHLTGTVTVHDDREWVRHAVTLLTETQELPRAEPWAVTDAPPKFVEGNLRAIVGVEMHVERVDAKAKLSQNRSEEDRAGVVAGLRDEPDPRSHAVADAMD